MQQSAKPMRIRLSFGAADKLKIHDVTPTYPKEARERLIDGTVLLLAPIDVSGKVINLKPQQGYPILTEAAMDAVKQWKYKPYQVKGQPVEVETVVKSSFTWDDRAKRRRDWFVLAAVVLLQIVGDFGFQL